MLGDLRWGDNWRVLSSDASVCVDVGRSSAKRRAASREILCAPAGARVVLRDHTGGKRALKRLARRPA
jgi:hypothetical protein